MTIADRFPLIENRLSFRAHRISQMHPDFDPEDILQTMKLALLERAEADPQFAEQTDYYLVQYAEWKAKNSAAASRTYRDYVDEMPRIVDDDGEESSLLEILPDTSQPPDEIYELHEAAQQVMEYIRSHYPDYVEMVELLYLGYSQNEIADALGVSKGAISQRKKKIAVAIKKRIA